MTYGLHLIKLVLFAMLSGVGKYTTTTFNNRELFLLLMKAKYENKIDHNEIFKDIINQLDPKLMNYPINPSIGKNKIANFVKKNVSKRTWENIKLVLKK